MPRRCCTSRKEARAPSRSHGNGRRKDRTNAALAIEHGIIFLERDSVDAAEAVPAPGHGVSAPALAELFLVGLTVGLRGGDQLLPIGRIDLPSVTAPREDLVFVLPVVGGRIRDLFLSKFLIIGVSFAQLFEMRTHVSRIRKFGRRGADESARKSRPPRRSQRAPRGPDMPVVQLACWFKSDACAGDGKRAQDFGRCRGADVAPGIGRNRTQFGFVPETYSSGVTWSTTKSDRIAAAPVLEHK